MFTLALDAFGLHRRWAVLYPCDTYQNEDKQGIGMRAEPQKHVDSIKEAMALLRRHL
jgi:hypothetical protein